MAEVVVGWVTECPTCGHEKLLAPGEGARQEAAAQGLPVVTWCPRCRMFQRTLTRIAHAVPAPHRPRTRRVKALV